MTKTIFFWAMLLAILANEKVLAQPSCKIIYNYDLSGNRVKRFLNCEVYDPFGPATNPSGTLISSVTPNPTTGGVVVVMSDAVPSLKVAVTDMSGVSILEQTINQETVTFPLDISAAVPGTYLVTIWALNQVDSYTIIKM